MRTRILKYALFGLLAIVLSAVSVMIDIQRSMHESSGGGVVLPATGQEFGSLVHRHDIVTTHRIEQVRAMIKIQQQQQQQQQRQRQQEEDAHEDVSVSAGLQFVGCYASEHQFTSPMYGGGMLGANVLMAGQFAKDKEKNYLAIARAGVDGHSLAFDTLPTGSKVPDSDCAGPCADLGVHFCGCSDKGCIRVKKKAMAECQDVCKKADWSLSDSLLPDTPGCGTDACMHFLALSTRWAVYKIKVTPANTSTAPLVSNVTVNLVNLTTPSRYNNLGM